MRRSLASVLGVGLVLWIGYGCAQVEMLGTLAPGGEPARLTPRFTITPGGVKQGQYKKLFNLDAAEVAKLTRGKRRLTAAQVQAFQRSFGQRQKDGAPFFRTVQGNFVLLPPSVVLKPPIRPQRLRPRQQIRAATAVDHDVLGAAAQPAGAVSSSATKTDSLIPIAAVMALGKSVSHRDAQTDVRHQGDRMTCTAFATCAALEAMIKPPVQAGGTEPHLCENLMQYLLVWDLRSTPCMDFGVQACDVPTLLSGDFIGDDTDWQYIGTKPAILESNHECALIDNPPGSVWDKTGYGIGSSTDLPDANEIDADNTQDIRDTATLEDLLDQGKDIVINLWVSWYQDPGQGVIDVMLDDSGQPIIGAGAHVLLLVGYDTTDPDPAKHYFLAKNSWGSYGDQGYLRFSHQYIRLQSRNGFVINQYSVGNTIKP